jgi:exodeoxyribonuclease V alpha subunit
MIYEGIINKVIFTGENNFAIISLTTQEKTITASGQIPYPIEGTRLKIEGEEFYNKNYNENQIRVSSAEAIGMSALDLAAIKFLSTYIYGFGDKKSQKLVLSYGNDLIDLFENHKDVIEKSVKNVKRVYEDFEDSRDVYEIFMITGGDITEKQAAAAINYYGKDAANIIRDNPYQLTKIKGLGFKKVDRIAKGTGIQMGDDKRIYAGIHYTLEEATTKNGHSYLLIDQLVENAFDLLFEYDELKTIYYRDILKTTVPDDLSIWEELFISTLSNKELKNIIANGYAQYDNVLSTEESECLSILTNIANKMREDTVRIINENSVDVTNEKNPVPKIRVGMDSEKELVTETINTNTAVYRSITFLCEYNVAKTLFALTKKPSLKSVPDYIINRVIAQIEKEDSIAAGAERHFNDDQRLAVKRALGNRISIITGGPGRGKTTILRAVCDIWGRNVKLLAPTGKAANKMTADTKRRAMTIHRLLAEAEKQKTCIFENALIVIDETSMVDLELINGLLKILPNSYHIVFVGDKDQLPSIGVGAILEDMIKSNTIPYTFLTKCYRNDGSILQNVDLVNAGGRVRDFKNDTHCRVLLDERSLKVESIVRIFQKQVSKYGLGNVMILVPKRTNAKGVENLNKLIQAQINPYQKNKEEISTILYKLRVGDRVINTKNIYDMPIKILDENGQYKDGLGVFNGDTGVIKAIYKSPEPKIVVEFDDGKIGYYGETKYSSASENFNRLSLAYAITIHKSQGSEYKSVILYMGMDSYILLGRKLLYTAMSRAKESLIMLGEPKAYHVAINNTAIQRRNSRMEYRLRQFQELYITEHLTNIA